MYVAPTNDNDVRKVLVPCVNVTWYLKSMAHSAPSEKSSGDACNTLYGGSACDICN